MVSRRNFVKQSGMVAAAGVVGMPGHLAAASMSNKNARASDLFRSNAVVLSERMDWLREVALTKAKELGAEYCDIRLTHKQEMSVNPFNGYQPKEKIVVGIRTLVKGYWGFSCSPILTDAEVLKLVNASYQQAKGNSQGPDRNIEIDRFIRNGSSGSWTMPIKEDPFDRNPFEYVDYLKGAYHYLQRFKGTDKYSLIMEFVKLDSWFGASNGSRTYQRTYRTSGQMGFKLNVANGSAYMIDTLTPAGKGLELFLDQDIYGLLRAGYEEALEEAQIPIVPVDIGRFEIVVDSEGMASLVAGTIGNAFELDRILGLESNSGGTSYVDDPVAQVGSLRVASSMIDVDWNRDEAGSVATVKWDDEGTPVSSGTLVKKGILNAVFSDRELAPVLHDESKVAAGSFVGIEANHVPLICPGNMVVSSEQGSGSLNSLVSSIEKGMLFKRGGIGLDFQLMSGMLTGTMFEVRKGRITNKVLGGGVLFRSTEFWNNITKIGSAESSKKTGISTNKGEPIRESFFSVTSPPAMFKDATVIDATRK